MCKVVWGTLTLILLSCSGAETHKPDPQQVFASELEVLKSYFEIPGMAAVVEHNGEIVYEDYLGNADLDTERKVDSTTLFPIASITKVFTGLLALKLEDQGLISLDDRVNDLIPGLPLSDSIRLKHLLSHTSQGQIGRQFYYSYRFGILSHVFEQAAGKPFEQVLQERLFEPMGLKNTVVLHDSAQVAPFRNRLASPYILDNGIEKGFIDYGLSSSAGIVSDARDLLKLSEALDTDVVIGSDRRTRMLSPFKEDLPYGLGIFSQNIQGIAVNWAYGQYDCYSSLLLKVPSQDLTLILLANNNLMSDPARLIMGDLMSSLFAISFLKNYAFDLPEMSLLEEPGMVYNNEYPEGLYRQKVLAQALAASFIARFDVDKMNTSAQLLERTFQAHPDYLSYANINLLHNLSFLKDVAFFKDLGPFDIFDSQIESIGQELLVQAPNNPYLHYYLGTYYDRSGNKERARFHFRSIVDLENFSPFWYTSEAMAWLKENAPKQSGLRIENGINRGIGYTDSSGADFNLRYIPITISNDSTVPIGIQIAFKPEYNFPSPNSTETFRLIPLPGEWGMGGIGVTKDMMSELTGLIKVPVLNSTLEAGGKMTLAIGSLYPKPPKTSGVLPNALFVPGEGELYESCDWQIDEVQAPDGSLTLGLTLKFGDSCTLIDCGKITYPKTLINE